MKSYGTPKILDDLELNPAPATTLTPSPASILLYSERFEVITSFDQDSSIPFEQSVPSGGGGATFAPHEYIPSEIWAEIFSVIVEGLPIQFPPDFSRPHWVLSRTCSRWRKIAFEEARVWNSIKVTSTSMFSAAKIAAFANRMVLPFGPLWILVNDDWNCPSFSAEVMGTLIIPHLLRTRALTLNLESDGYSQFFRAPPESFSSLEVLDLKFGLYAVDKFLVQAFQTTTIFNRAQALRKLKLTSFTDSEIIDRLCGAVVATPVPWHQLMELDLGLTAMNLADIHRLLHQCTNLQAFNANIRDNHVLDAPTKFIDQPHTDECPIIHVLMRSTTNLPQRLIFLSEEI